MDLPSNESILIFFNFLLIFLKNLIKKIDFKGKL